MINRVCSNGVNKCSIWRKSWRVNKILSKKEVKTLKNKMQSMNQCVDIVIVEERMVCKSGMEKLYMIKDRNFQEHK